MSKQIAPTVKPPGRSCASNSSQAAIAERKDSLRPHSCVQRDSTENSLDPSAASLVREAVSSQGAPLEPRTQSFMEPHIGHDLSAIRVHTDAKAAESNRALDANAYTLGQHIVFDRGKYQPESRDGNQLLAHELFHTTQQAGTENAPVNWNSLQVSEPGDPAERHAVASASVLAASSTIASPVRTNPASTGATTVFRDKKKAPPAKKKEQAPVEAKPAENKDFAEAEWEDTQAMITPEFENAYQDVVRAAVADAKFQVHDMVEPYSGAISDSNKTFNAVMGAFLGGAGNAPNDPPLPSTSRFAAYQTTSGSGFLAGLIAQAMQGALGIILDTGSIDDIKENASLDVEEMISQDMSIDSELFGRYENAQMARMHAMFNTLVELSKMGDANPASRDSAQFRRKFMNEVVRKEFGVHGDTGKQALDGVSDQLHMFLESKLRPELIKIKHEQDNKRFGYGALGGALGGGIIGATLGFELSKGGLGWGLGGAAIGLAGGAVLGLIGAAIFKKKDPNPSKDPSPAEKRRERLKDRKKGIDRALPAPFG